MPISVVVGLEELEIEFVSEIETLLQLVPAGMHLFCSMHHSSPLGQMERDGVRSGISSIPMLKQPIIFGMHRFADSHQYVPT